MHLSLLEKEAFLAYPEHFWAQVNYWEVTGRSLGVQLRSPLRELASVRWHECETSDAEHSLMLIKGTICSWPPAARYQSSLIRTPSGAERPHSSGPLVRCRGNVLWAHGGTMRSVPLPCQWPRPHGEHGRCDSKSSCPARSWNVPHWLNTVLLNPPGSPRMAPQADDASRGSVPSTNLCPHRTPKILSMSC